VIDIMPGKKRKLAKPLEETTKANKDQDNYMEKS